MKRFEKTALFLTYTALLGIALVVAASIISLFDESMAMYPGLIGIIIVGIAVFSLLVIAYILMYDNTRHPGG